MQKPFQTIQNVFWTIKNNEPFTFSIDGKNIADFLGECGHKIVRHLNQDQIETTYLKKADGSSIGKPNGLFNMIITSPEVWTDRLIEYITIIERHL